VIVAVGEANERAPATSSTAVVAGAHRSHRPSYFRNPVPPTARGARGNARGVRRPGVRGGQRLTDSLYRLCRALDVPLEAMTKREATSSVEGQVAERRERLMALMRQPPKKLPRVLGRRARAGALMAARS